MSACLDVGGLADCLIGYHSGRTGAEILDTYARVRREIFLRYIDARSIKNLKRVAESDPWSVAETDKFFGILRGLNGDPEKLKEFLLVSCLPWLLLCGVRARDVGGLIYCRNGPASSTTLRNTTTSSPRGQTACRTA